MTGDPKDLDRTREPKPIDESELGTREEEAIAQSRRLESMGYVTASAIHDFNNLLTPILCASTLLELELRPGTDAHSLTIEIRDAAERAAELVRQLMRFARKQPVVVRRVDVNATIRELGPLLARGLPEDVRLVLDLHHEPLHAIVDRGRFENALLNLVANARDAMPMGGKVVIATAAAAGHPKSADAPAERSLVLTVSDQGEGMSAEVHAHLYERWFTTKAGRGTGLGLPAVRAFVVEAGGHMSVHSELGNGTTVAIHLPRAASSEKVEPSSAASPKPARGTETIMIVEDDEPVRRTLASVLERHGYSVMLARSGNSALEMAATTPRIDLVIVDVVMPKMSGHDVVDRLKSYVHGLKILFVSGHTAEIVEGHQGPSEGALMIRKPFSVEELLRRVRDVLDAPVN